MYEDFIRNRYTYIYVTLCCKSIFVALDFKNKVSFYINIKFLALSTLGGITIILAPWIETVIFYPLNSFIFY